MPVPSYIVVSDSRHGGALGEARAEKKEDEDEDEEENVMLAGEEDGEGVGVDVLLLPMVLVVCLFDGGILSANGERSDLERCSYGMIWIQRGLVDCKGSRLLQMGYNCIFVSPCRPQWQSRVYLCLGA